MVQDAKVTTLEDDASVRGTKKVQQASVQDTGNDQEDSGVSASGLSGKKVKVKFFNTEDDTSPIKASLNGVAYQIPRNETSEIPVELLEIFNNAQVMFTDGNGELAFKPRHSYQVIA